MNALRKSQVTIRDVMDGLEAMESWARQLREALAGLDQGQTLAIQPRLAAVSPAVSGGACPPPPRPPKGPKPPKPPKKGGKKA